MNKKEVINNQKELIEACYSDIRQLNGEVRRLSSEVSVAFEAGYQFGRDDAWHNYPPRPKGAYNEWRKAPVSEGREHD